MSDRPYHDPGYPELEEFEDHFDRHLADDDMLTADERRVRDNLIEGVMMMYEKVCKWKRGE